MSKIKHFFIINILLILSCKDIHQVIPNVNVFISLDKNTDLAQLGVGSTMIYPGGNLGIIIFRNGIDEYYAFDRMCTYYPNDTSAVVAKDGGIIAICPKCGSTFVFNDGEAQHFNGPAKMPLKKYYTYLNGSRLTISN